MIAPEKTVTTAEALLRLPTGLGERYELVKGELKIMSPAGFEHGEIAMALGERLRAYVRKKHLGAVPAAETGYRLRTNPDTVRAPDVSFVSKARREKLGRLKGYFPGAPDLAVEVVSPDDAAELVKSKVKEYFDAGSKLVWIIYPETRDIVVFRSARKSEVVSFEDTLDGGDVLPGFTCPVRELFE